jgi:hypothetical protein
MDPATDAAGSTPSPSFVGPPVADAAPRWGGGAVSPTAPDDYGVGGDAFLGVAVPAWVAPRASKRGHMALR